MLLIVQSDSRDLKNSVATSRLMPRHFRAKLELLAESYGVATHYRDTNQNDVVVDDDIIIAILAQFEVDASTMESLDKELAALDKARKTVTLPPTLVLREGQEYPLNRTAQLFLENGEKQELDSVIASNLPLGWHRLVVPDQEITLVVVPTKLPEVPPAWGWMLQLYALHSAQSWGMGDFEDLTTMVRRSGSELGAGLVLVNPVQAIGPDHPIERSPYSPISRQFINPLYLRVTATPEFLAADASTQEQVLALKPDASDLIDYDQVWDAKITALELLYRKKTLPPALNTVTTDSRDFATFCALAEIHGSDWRQWPKPLRDPTSDEVARIRTELAERVSFHLWLQELCRTQLTEAKTAAHAAGMSVGVVHDLPVGVNAGGADTWSNRDVFAIEVAVGAPPDGFNQQGQNWGLPPWRPDRLAESGYAPFRDMIRSVLAHADGIRIDHIAGLWRLWWIPPNQPPHRGTYVRYDADAMMGILALEAHRASAVVVGEDLGTVEPQVTRTMQDYGVLSSAVLWFERDWRKTGEPFIPPARWKPNTMASISTHDMPTATGWLDGEHVRLRAELGLLTCSVQQEYDKATADRAALIALLNQEGIPSTDLLLALHTLLASASSSLILVSPADVLGEVRQPNLPGTIDQYPNWRISLPASIEKILSDHRVLSALAPVRAARPPIRRNTVRR